MSMTKDEALETIAVMLQDTKTDCDYAYDNMDGSEDLLPGQDIADALRLALAALREQEERRWIPVTERLPKQGTVLVTDGNIVITAPSSSVTADGQAITHWIPLPEPPKEV